MATKNFKRKVDTQEEEANTPLIKKAKPVTRSEPPRTRSGRRTPTIDGLTRRELTAEIYIIEDDSDREDMANNNLKPPVR